MSDRYKALHIGDQWLVIDYQPPERTVCLCVNYDLASEMAAALNKADETERLREQARAGFDVERVLEWQQSPNRKPAASAFTSGSERQVADLIEWEAGRLRGLLGRAWVDMHNYGCSCRLSVNGKRDMCSRCQTLADIDAELGINS